MALFICYSHADKEFVDKFATELVMNKARVWLDRWELNVGDSLIQRVQDAIGEADALLVVLSHASVNSEWCKRELSAATMRELNEKKVLVLPVVIDDCKIPLLLQEKLYADFRAGFESGLSQVLEAVAKVTSDTLGRINGKEYLTDYSVYWEIQNDLFVIDIFLISIPSIYPFTIFTIAKIVGNEAATERFRQFAREGLGSYAKDVVLGICADAGLKMGRKLMFQLDDSQPVEAVIPLSDSRRPEKYNLIIEIRRLGEDTGKNILFDCGAVLQQIFETSLKRAKKFDKNQTIALAKILSRNQQ